MFSQFMICMQTSILCLRKSNLRPIKTEHRHPVELGSKYYLLYLTLLVQLGCVALMFLDFVPVMLFHLLDLRVLPVQNLKPSPLV